jgi:hypothetical protein
MVSTQVRRRDNAGRFGRVKAAAVVTAAAAATVLALAPTASAAVEAPAGFDVTVSHASGTLVARLQGNLAWSTSGRTVSFTGQQLFVKADECVHVAYAGYQSNTLVTSFNEFNACGPGSGGFENRSISTDKPGGIQHVIIELTDTTHGAPGAKASDDCWKSESVCRSRP